MPHRSIPRLGTRISLANTVRAEVLSAPRLIFDRPPDISRSGETASAASGSTRAKTYSDPLSIIINLATIVVITVREDGHRISRSAHSVSSSVPYISGSKWSCCRVAGPLDHVDDLSCDKSRDNPSSRFGILISHPPADIPMIS